MSKISVSLPDNLVVDLTRASKLLGFSRSALISHLLSGSVDSILSVMGELPLEPSEGDIKRFKGKSVSELSSVMDQLTAEIGHLKGQLGDIK